MARLLQNLMNEYDGEEESRILNIKNVRLGALLLCVLCEAAALFFTDWKIFGAGLILGGGVAQLLFRQHELGIGKMFGGGDPKNITVSNYFLRLLIRGVAVFAAIKNPNVSILGCVLGLLSISYAIYALAFLNAFLHRKNRKGGIG